MPGHWGAPMLTCPHCGSLMELHRRLVGPEVPCVPPSRQPYARWHLSCEVCDCATAERATPHGARDAWLRVARGALRVARRTANMLWRDRPPPRARCEALQADWARRREAAREALRAARVPRDALRAACAAETVPRRRSRATSTLWLPRCRSCGAWPAVERVRVTDRTPGLGAVRVGWRVVCQCGTQTWRRLTGVYVTQAGARRAWLAGAARPSSWGRMVDIECLTRVRVGPGKTADESGGTGQGTMPPNEAQTGDRP